LFNKKKKVRFMFIYNVCILYMFNMNGMLKLEVPLNKLCNLNFEIYIIQPLVTNK